MRKSGAFTIVEIIITISIVAILSAIAIITFDSIRADSRNATRQGNATIVSEALEKYYEQNGEYPSVASIVNTRTGNTGAAVASKLSIPVASLAMPNMPSDTTNAIVPGDSLQNDYLAYEAQSAENNVGCQNDPNAGCDTFKLRYLEEGTEEVKEIASRHAWRSTTSEPELVVSSTGPSSIDAVWTQMPTASSYTLLRSLSSDMSSPVTTNHTGTTTMVTGLTFDTEYFFTVRAATPNGDTGWSEVESATTSNVTTPTGTITIAASMSGANAHGVAGGGSCIAGTTIEYQIRYRENAATWSGWTTGTPRDIPATEGYTYTFQAQARCKAGSVGGPWVASTTAAVTRGVTAPSGLTIAAAMSGTNARGTAGGGSCATGTTLQRQIRYQVNGGTWQAYATATSYRDVAATSGYRYTFQQQARCAGTNASSGWVASGTAYVDRPVAAPSGLTITAAISGSTAVGTAGGGSCPAGTTIARQIRYKTNGGAYVAYTTATSRSVAASQGYRYTFQQQAQCVGTYLSSGYAASGTASATRTIATPAAPGISNSTSGSTTTWTGSGSCPSGTTRYYQRRSLQQGGSWSAWGGTTTSNVSTWNTSAQGYTYYRQYRAQCTTAYTSSAWSTNSATSSYARPISVGTASGWTHVSLGWQHESNCKYYNGCKWRRYNWTNPTCPAGTSYYRSSWNSYVGSKMSWDNGRSSIYRWWTGNSQTTTTSDSLAYSGITTSHIVEYSSNVPSNYDNVRHKLIFTCRNSTTGVTGTTETYSPMFRYM